MRGHLVGFHFCPILLSGVALFLVTFSSSLHTDLSRDEVFKRVEGITWMCYTSVITPWNFFRRFVHFWSPFILCWPQQIPLSDGMWMCQVPWAKSRIGWQILAVTINFIYIYAFNTVIFNFQRDVKVSIAMGENSDRMTQKKKNFT